MRGGGEIDKWKGHKLKSNLRTCHALPVNLSQYLQSYRHGEVQCPATQPRGLSRQIKQRDTFGYQRGGMMSQVTVHGTGQKVLCGQPQCDECVRCNKIPKQLKNIYRQCLGRWLRRYSISNSEREEQYNKDTHRSIGWLYRLGRSQGCIFRDSKDEIAWGNKVMMGVKNIMVTTKPYIRKRIGNEGRKRYVKRMGEQDLESRRFSMQSF